MLQREVETSLLESLHPDFRRAVEASADSIVTRIAAALTPSRLDDLAALARDEGMCAYSREAAETAFALSAELKRRANLLRH